MTSVTKESSTNCTIKVRDARGIDDLKEIHVMIKEWLEYQKLAMSPIDFDHLVTNSGLVPPNTTTPYFHSFVAEALNETTGQTEIIGYSLDYFMFKTGPGGLILYIADLFVKDNWRGKHVGYLLLKQLAVRAKQHCVKSMRLQCQESNPSTKFYEKYGGKFNGKSEDWIDYVFHQEALDQLVQ